MKKENFSIAVTQKVNEKIKKLKIKMVPFTSPFQGMYIE